jgi:hypothetical protein
VIKRIFRVVKRKYQILHTPSEYSIATQNRIILACYTLYNFVRSIEGESADNWLETESKDIVDIQLAVIYSEGTASSKKIDKFRDNIAEKI